MADGSFPPDMTRNNAIVGFAGGGGSSVAFKLATGCDPDLAMNHWLTAVLAHQRHFPLTEHHCADIFDVDPRSWRPGERIAFGWFSPDCTDFSKAKGKAPRSERIRGLAWSVIPWARFRAIDVIMLENVEEFEQWGPVHRGGPHAGEPIVERRGETFARWRRRLTMMGYAVEWRVLNAADYGAPTTRKRLYVIARRDGQPIVWPPRTHAPRKTCAALGLKPWRGACEIIDLNIDCPSIFLTKDEVDDLRRRTGKRVQRPLVPATHRRILVGVDRYVISSAEPYIVDTTQRTWGGDRAHGVRDPLRTIMSSKGGEFALVQPDFALLSSVAHGQDPRAWPISEPARTQTGKHDKALVTGTLVGLAHGEHAERAGSRTRDVREPIQTVSAGGGDAALTCATLVPRYGEREGQEPRARDCEEPLATVVPDGNGGSLAAASLVQMNTRDVGGDVRDPARTATEKEHQALSSTYLVRQFGTGGPRDIEEPTATNTSGGERGGEHTQLVTAFMAQGNGDRLGRPIVEPVTTLTERATQQQIVAASLDTYYSSGKVGGDAGEPMRAATGQDRHSLIATWLEQANTGMVGHAATAPVSTIVAGGGPDCGWGGATQRLVQARLEQDGGPVGRRAQVLAFLWSHFGLPTQDEWDAPVATLDARRKFGLVILRGQTWMIVDIGLRMLLPKELAAAMGLPPEYDLTVNAMGAPISKTHQTQMIGNMVSPPPAAAMIAANCPNLRPDKEGLIQPEERVAA